MPYIVQDDRDLLDIKLNLNINCPKNAGELNYIITRLVKTYLRDNGTSYKTINEMIGALECCKLELYSRIASPYEDLKREQNGDVK